MIPEYKDKPETSRKIGEFFDVLKKKAIYPVFQPIIDLSTGRAMGYEALSRIALDDISINIEELFCIAEHVGRVWELEKLCRNKALKTAAAKPVGSKLFLNVDGNVFQDASFIRGFTNRKAQKAGVPSSDIVFEITERSDIENYQILQKIMKHYSDQGYEIALDDVGSGYSGLNRVVNTSPNYLKADIELVRDIHKSKAKRIMVEMLLRYCNETGAYLIAEGIETAAELKCLCEMGVHYGQGYYLRRPDREFKALSAQALAQIADVDAKRERNMVQSA